MSADLSNLSTFQMAFGLQWSVKNLRRVASKEGAFYFVDLNGETMRATEARRRCIAEIEKRQH